jgi:hypothetical protein
VRRGGGFCLVARKRQKRFLKNLTLPAPVESYVFFAPPAPATSVREYVDNSNNKRMITIRWTQKNILILSINMVILGIGLLFLLLE